MNNINSQDVVRAVVSDNSPATKGQQAASSESAQGKDLPVLDAGNPPRAQQEAPSAPQQSARVEKAVAQLNDYVQSLQRDLRFSLDEELGRSVVKVIDRNSDEVIRQIPNETALQLARNLKEHLQDQQVQLQSQELEVSQEQSIASLGLINTRI